MHVTPPVPLVVYQLYEYGGVPAEGLELSVTEAPAGIDADAGVIAPADRGGTTLPKLVPGSTSSGGAILPLNHWKVMFSAVEPKD